MGNRQPSLIALHLMEETQPIEKICIKCGLTKPFDMFVKQTLGRFGRCNTCKKCGSAYNMRKYWELPVEKRKKSPEAHQKRLRDARQAVFTHYGGRCECCKEENWKFLTVDHITPIGKKRDEAGHRRILFWLVRNNFPTGYRLLCWNCNVGRYHNGGVCPHQMGSQAISQESSGKRREVPDVLPKHEDMVDSFGKPEAVSSSDIHDNAAWPLTERIQ
jgi:hypothetical protein